MTCSVEGCARKPHAKGLCSPHYKRLWREGKPREAAPVVEKRRRAHDRPGHHACHICQEVTWLLEQAEAPWQITRRLGYSSQPELRRHLDRHEHPKAESITGSHT